MKKIKNPFKNKLFISVMLIIIFLYVCLAMSTFSMYRIPPQYVVYNIVEEYDIATDLIVVESIDGSKIKITDKKIISEILYKFNTVPSIKRNLEKSLGTAYWTIGQSNLDEDLTRKTLIFNSFCKVTIYGGFVIHGATENFDYFSVEYNGKLNKYETVQKGFYADIMKLVDESVSNLE